MLLKQYYLGCLSQASYMIADEATRTAAIVDPRRDVDEYLRDAAALGVEIKHAILTHFHADFVAGHLELRARVGARIHLGARAVADYPFAPLKDGDEIAFGSVRLVAIETPGHTPEAISLAVYDLGQDAGRPHAVLTGDTLFIGDVGRPDLMVSDDLSAEDLAGWLYDSLHGKLLRLPDETLVYPAHGAGSMCGKSLSAETVSTIGAQRRDNYALQPMSRDAFVRLITADQPDPPAYFKYDADLNRREHRPLDEALGQELRALTLDELLDRQRQGAQLLDARDPADFAAGHLVGSTNVGIGGRFAMWCGILFTPTRPIVFVAAPGKEEHTAMRLGRIGFDNIAGYLNGGIEAAATRPELLRQNDRIPPTALPDLIDRGVPIVDVRFEGEHRAEAIPGSINIPLHQLCARMAEVPAAPAIVVYCLSGVRSSTAASLLEQAGRSGVLDLIGGITAWKAQAPAPR